MIMLRVNNAADGEAVVLNVAGRTWAHIGDIQNQVVGVLSRDSRRGPVDAVRATSVSSGAILGAGKEEVTRISTESLSSG